MILGLFRSIADQRLPSETGTRELWSHLMIGISYLRTIVDTINMYRGRIVIQSLLRDHCHVESNTV